MVSKRFLQLSVLVLCVVASASSALAQKKGGGSAPPSGPVPPGTIYFSGWFSTSGSDGYIGMSMKGDFPGLSK
jgi:hypothetical protein